MRNITEIEYTTIGKLYVEYVKIHRQRHSFNTQCVCEVELMDSRDESCHVRFSVGSVDRLYKYRHDLCEGCKKGILELCKENRSFLKGQAFKKQIDNILYK